MGTSTSVLCTLESLTALDTSTAHNHLSAERWSNRWTGPSANSTETHDQRDRMNIIITADHGMSTVSRNGLVKEIILSKIPGLSIRDLAFYIVGFGPAAMLLPKEGRIDKVYKALKEAHLSIRKRRCLLTCITPTSTKYYPSWCERYCNTAYHHNTNTHISC